MRGTGQIELAEVKSKIHNINKKGIIKRIKKDKFYLLLMFPGVLFFLIFRYIPMIGVIMGFKDVNPFGGISAIFTAPWVGLKHFQRFFESYYFGNILGNTLIISTYRIVFGFPLPILFALLLNEVRNVKFKKIVQSISYIPHFISFVVITGFIYAIFSSETGLLNNFLDLIGIERISFIGSVRYFRGIIVGSSIWQNIGWGSIVYLAAISNINTEQYQAALIDGANRFQQAVYITIPGIAPIIAIMLILRVGRIMDAGFEQILLLYSSQVYQVADIIDTYVYREGIIGMNFSYTTAIGLFKSVIAMALVMGTNYITKKIGQPGIW